MPNELSQFAELCLAEAPELGVSWIKQLFSSNGSGERDLSESIQKLVLITEQKPILLNNADLLEQYREAVVGWASNVDLFSGTNFKIADGFVQSTIRRKKSHGTYFSSETSNAEELLQRSHTKTVIVGTPGTGKSVLLRSLAGTAAQLVNSSLPVPIDYMSIQNGANPLDAIRSAIFAVWPDCLPQNLDALTQALNHILEYGQGVALLDNWEWETLQRINVSAKWKRVICFAHPNSRMLDESWDIYELQNLDWSSISQFVRSWSQATGTVIDDRRLLERFYRNEFSKVFAETPILLDLTCSAFAQDAFKELQVWRVLKRALTHQIMRACKGNDDPELFQTAIGDFALSLLVNQRSITFKSSEVFQFWLDSDWRTYAKRFIGLLRTCGILKLEGEQFTFVNPLFQSVLAAQSWSTIVLRDGGNWSTEFNRAKYDPSWADTVVFTFGILSEESNKGPKRVSILTTYFEQLFLVSDDPLGLRFVLAGKCLATLSSTDCEFVLQNKFIESMIFHLIDDAQELMENGLDCKLYIEVLGRIAVGTVFQKIEKLVYNRRAATDQRLLWLNLLCLTQQNEVVGTLVRLVEDIHEDENIRQKAAQLIGATGLSKVLPVLKSWLEEPLSRFAVVALVLHNSMAAARLLQETKDKAAICQMRNPEILPMLTDLFKNHIIDTNLYFSSIGRIDGEQAMRSLTEALGSKDKVATTASAKNLALMNTKHAAATLVAFLVSMRPEGDILGIILDTLSRNPKFWIAKPIIELIEGSTIEDINFVQNCLQVLRKKNDIETRLVAENAFSRQTDKNKKRWLASILVNFNSLKVLPWLREELADGRFEVRVEALIGLLMLGEPSALDKIIVAIEDALRGNHNFSRLCLAVRGLDDARLVPILWRGFNEGTGQGDYVAFDVLYRMDCSSLEDDIINKLHESMTLGFSLQKRRWLLELLSNIGTPRSIQTIVDVASKSAILHDTTYAIQSLSQVRDPRAVDILVVALSNPNKQVRYSAIEALNFIDVEYIEPLILPIVWIASDSDQFMCQLVLNLLQNLEPLSSIHDMTTALFDENPNVRLAVLLVLEKSPTEIAAEELITHIKNLILNDKETKVQYQAAVTLGKLDRVQAQYTLLQLVRSKKNWREHEKFARLLIKIGDSTIVDQLYDVLKITDTKLWREMVSPQFLCGLILGLPATKTLLLAFCLKYNVHLMADGSVIDSTGNSLTCDEFQNWMAMQ